MPESINREMIKEILSIRAKDAHKGNFGRTLIIAGSEGMMGAAVLALRGALRSGVGLATVSCQPSFFPVIHCGVPEAMCKSRSLQAEDLKKYDSIAAGPGLGVSRATQTLIQTVLNNYSGPVILDADALNTIAEYSMDISEIRAELVMTPHEAEAARLLHIGTGEIRKNRKAAAMAIAEKYASSCVLKGAETIIASSNGEVFINTTGNPGMATGGSGDVLTGVLASFAAQFAKERKALSHVVSAGVYIHGLAGDLAANVLGEYGLIAGDIASYAPFAIKEIINI